MSAPENSALEAIEFWHRKCRDAEAALLVAERERDEAVGIALWLAAIDAVEIQHRVEWVDTIKARYDDIRERRAAVSPKGEV